jgi:hypothetical protein
VSDGLVGVDRGDEQIEPLIVSVNNSDYAHVPVPKPVHGNLSAAVEPDAVRSPVPSGHDQRDPTDRGSLGFECVGQCGEFDGWICRTWPPRAVESTCWEAVGLQAEPRAGGGRDRARDGELVRSDIALVCPVPGGRCRGATENDVEPGRLRSKLSATFALRFLGAGSSTLPPDWLAGRRPPPGKLNLPT